MDPWRLNISPHFQRHIMAIWKSSIAISIHKPDKDSSPGTSYRPLSLLYPAANVMEALILTTVNIYLLPAADQHGFRPGNTQTLLLYYNWRVYVATGFNQRNPPHRRICVAVDLTAAFDTVNHNVLLSKSAKSTLFWGNLSMVIELHQGSTIRYKLQTRQVEVEGKDTP